MINTEAEIVQDGNLAVTAVENEASSESQLVLEEQMTEVEEKKVESDLLGTDRDVEPAPNAVGTLLTPAEDDGEGKTKGAGDGLDGIPLTPSKDNRKGKTKASVITPEAPSKKTQLMFQEDDDDVTNWSPEDLKSLCKTLQPNTGAAAGSTHGTAGSAAPDTPNNGGGGQALKKILAKRKLSRSDLDALHIIHDNDMKMIMIERHGRECIAKRYEIRQENKTTAEQEKAVRQKIWQVNADRILERDIFNKWEKDSKLGPKTTLVDNKVQKLWDIARGPNTVNRVKRPGQPSVPGVTQERLDKITRNNK